LHWTANRPGSQRVVWPEDIALFQSASPCHALRTGTVRRPACLGPRTVPARSRLSGLKTSPFPRAPRPATRCGWGPSTGRPASDREPSRFAAGCLA